MKHVIYYILCVIKKKRGDKANDNKWGYANKRLLATILEGRQTPRKIDAITHCA